MQFYLAAAALVPMKLWPKLERHLVNRCIAAEELPCDIGIKREVTLTTAREIISARREPYGD